MYLFTLIVSVRPPRVEGCARQVEDDQREVEEGQGEAREGEGRVQIVGKIILFNVCFVLFCVKIICYKCVGKLINY